MIVLEKTRKKLEETKSGKLAMWEWGGGFTNTGDATIICNSDGSKKKAIYVRRKGHLANAEHALVTVSQGDYIIDLFRRRNNYTIRVYVIEGFVKSQDGISWVALIQEVFRYQGNKWFPSQLPSFLEPAVEAGKEKSKCYHCREPHFVE